MAAATVPQNSANELHIVRLFDAPVKAVWDAWTDPEQVGKWWGPRGFTITTHAKDLRPGGHWKYTMHGPDGTDYPNTTTYYEVVKHAKLVYDHGGSDERAPLFRVTVLFSESRGKTKMDMTMTLPTAEAAAETKAFIRKVGGNSTWDRLAEYLEKQATGKDAFVINRSFDVPRDVMFDIWTKPEHFSRWLGPAGFEMQFLRADVRPGGSNFYRMTGPFTMYGKIDYIAIEKPGRIVYTQHFCDEHEKPARHPKLSTWPAVMLTTITFTEEGPNATRVTVTWEPHGTISREEVETFIQMRAGMNQGWTGSFDKLETLFSNA